MKENDLSAYGSKCYKNVSAKEICSFKGGGIVKRLFVPLNADELIRTINTLNEREEDYAVMQGMMFGEYPTFSELMAFIQELEAEINAF